MDKGIVLVTELLQGGELFERWVHEIYIDFFFFFNNMCVDEEATLKETIKSKMKLDKNKNNFKKVICVLMRRSLLVRN